MRNRIKILLFFLFSVFFMNAQINPRQGSKLNYTQVMFEYDEIPGSDEYLVQVAYGDAMGGFGRLIKEQRNNSTATLISNLTFGKRYSWRYAGIKAGKQLPWNGPYNFEIADNPAINMNFFECRVLKNDTIKNESGVLAIDYAKLVIDRYGNPVWYLPLVNTLYKETGGARDLRITGTGTFLFIANNSAYECDLNGNVLWRAPDNGKVSGDTTEYYHHDVKKLKNGNYMILGEKYIWKEIPPEADITKFKPENTDVTGPVHKVKILFSTIIEYNKGSQVVWSWNSGDYFSDKDIFSKETTTNNPRRDLPANAEIFGHMNAFDVDAEGKFIYAGFRDISRIIKIDKHSGQVVDSWGLKLPSGEALEGNDFFKNQHDVNILPGGDIVVFNNNGLRETDNTSSVVEFSQKKQNQPAQITWVFNCKFDSLTNGKSSRNGGVDYLENDNMLICMGALGRVSEVMKSTKEVVWDAFFETKGAENAPWISLPLYRVHYSSSLYPLYFTVQSKKEKITSNVPSVNITIYNEGTNADSYAIKIKSATALDPKVLKSGIILPCQSKSIHIQLQKVLPNTDKITALVSSITDPGRIKRLSIKISK